MATTMKGGTRPILMFLVVVSCLLLFASASPQESLNRPKQRIQIRDLLGPPTSPSTTSSSPSSSANSEPPPTSTSTSAAPTSTTTHTSSTSAPPSSSQQQQQTSSTPAPSSSASSDAPTSAPPTSTTPESTVVASTATASDGRVITSVITVPQSTTASPSPTQTNSSSSGSSGLGTGSIVGLSVAGGVAVIGIISFFIWKFTRKRFSDFDDNEAIKWPELNAHGGVGGDVHALPTNSTGRAGFGAENESDLNLARAPSPAGGYAHSVAASSVPDVYAAGQDPYAVPPLPHLNPNQPYHDDPGSYGQPGYYDPYRGPVPNTFNDALSDGHGAEAIPMTQMARIRSPAPQVPFDLQARASPGPQAVLAYGGGMDDRSRSPNPATLGAGRASPGPQAAYGYGPR